MALTLCPECQKQVSSRAASCPHCGFPLSRGGGALGGVPPEQPPAPIPAPAPDFNESLLKLAKLKEDGVITEAEYQAKVKALQAARTPNQQPKQNQASQGLLGCLGIIVLVLIIAWLSNIAGCNETGQQSTSPHLPSKAEWRQKVRPYWNPGGPIKLTTIADFKNLVGEPSHTQTMEGIAYWYYECSDGSIQLELVDPNMSGGRLLIREVNDF